MLIESTYPLYVWILVGIGCVALAWFTYKNLLHSTETIWAYPLILLRSLVFLLVLGVLLDVVFEQEREIEEKSTIVVLLDSSESVSITKNEYKGIPSYIDAIERAFDFDTTKTRFTFYGFDRTVNRIAPQSVTSLQAIGTDTDIHQAVNQINEQHKGIDAMLVFTDGIFTIGNDPSSLLNVISYPIFTIALGDTSAVRDIVVSKVNYPEKAYRKSPFQLTALIDQEGFNGVQTDVELLQAGEVIQRKKINFNSAKSQTEVNFILESEQSGLQQYEIRIPVQRNEWNTRNNKRLFSLEVVDERIRILHLAFEIHPDIRSFRSIVHESEDLSLYTFTWLGATRFAEGLLPATVDTIDLVVLHGFTPTGLPKAIREYVEALVQDKPLLWLPLPKTEYNATQEALSAVLPFTFQRLDAIYPIVIRSEPAQSSHPILSEISLPDELRSPLLYSPLRSYSLRTSAQVLLRSGYRGSDIESPLLMIQTIGNQRSAALMAFGLYEWTLHPDESIRQFASQMLRNTLAWLAAPASGKLLSVSNPRRQWSTDENVVFNAFLNNESGQFDASAKIEITLTGATIETKRFTFENKGFGQYTQALGTLPAGSYRYAIQASKNGTLIDAIDGEFVVSSSNAELVNTKRNDVLLRYLANGSGGAFYKYDQTSMIEAELESKGLLSPKVILQQSSYPLRNSPYWLLLLLILLSAEWGIRKYLALS